MNRRWLAAVGLLGALLAGRTAAVADAAPRRFALAIGANAGDAADPQLRYAERDATRIAEVLRELGAFAAEDVQVLTNATAGELRRALEALGKRARDAPGDSLLFVFYSGHGDADALHLRGTRLATSELRELIDATRATMRILVVDACWSGGLTRTKGGRAGPGFAIDLDDRLRSRGLAILSSSADGEDSQESDRLQASFFTHYLASGLRGAADDDTDGRITLGEAFGYASQHTISATTQTVAGPQHPTYRYDLAGREDLVLTYTSARQPGVGSLSLAEPGTYVVQRRDASGPMVAEVTVARDPRTLAVAPGDYFVTRRAPDHLLQRAFVVARGSTTAVAAAGMARIAYAQLVRKGGPPPRRTTLGAFATLGARGGVGSESSALRIEGGLRIERRALALELRIHATDLAIGTVAEATRARELGATVAALAGLDRGAWSVAAGAATGPAWRTIVKAGANPGTSTDASLGAVVGVVGQIRRSLTRRLDARLDLGMLGYWFGDDASGQSGIAVRFAGAIGAGLGARF